MATYENLTSTPIEGEVDLNSLFNLTYNFDMLKSILENLLKQQKGTNDKLKDFEDQLEKKDERIAKYD